MLDKSSGQGEIPDRR